MTKKPYIILALCATSLQFASCKKDRNQETEKHFVAGNYVNLGITTDFKLLEMKTSYLDGGSDMYKFHYNEMDMVDTILFSNISKGRGVGYNEIHKYYYIDYDNKSWPSKITMTSFDPQGKPSYYLVKYNEEKGTITELTNDLGTVQRSIQYDGDNAVRLEVNDEPYNSQPIDYVYEQRNVIISGYMVDSGNYDKTLYTEYDNHITYIAAIHGLDNILSLVIFNWTDLYNNTTKWEQHRMSTTADGQKYPYNRVGTCLYTYNTVGLPITRQETINGVVQTTTYSYTQ